MLTEVFQLEYHVIGEVESVQLLEMLQVLYLPDQVLLHEPEERGEEEGGGSEMEWVLC